MEIQDDGYFCKIVYHAVGDRQGKITRSKVVVMFNTSNLRFQIIWCHETCDSKSFGATIDRTIGPTILRLIVRSVT